MNTSEQGNVTVMHDNRPAEREETRSTERYSRPAVDILETEEGLTIIADVPGATREMLSIGIDKGILTIQADVEPHLAAKELYREFAVGSYYRQFQLPEMVDPEKAKAELSNGVLMLHLPKAEHAKPRRIEIRGVH